MLNPVKYSINISSSCRSPGAVGRIPYTGQHGREFLTSGIYSAASRSQVQAMPVPILIPEFHSICL